MTKEGGGRREKRKGKIPEGGIPRLGSLEKDSIIMVDNKGGGREKAKSLGWYS